MLKPSFLLTLGLISSLLASLFSSASHGTAPSLQTGLENDSIAEEAKANFSAYALRIYNNISEPTLSWEAFEKGLIGYTNLVKEGKISRLDTLTIVDFSKPSAETRLFVIDLHNEEIIYRSLCAHGRNSGALYAEHFSNQQSSRKSSLGFYVTQATYSGKYRLALRLQGMEHSNDQARSRGIVLHTADYVSYDFLDRNDCQLGRSHGCPVVPRANFDCLVDWIKDGSCFFIYHPSAHYQSHSNYLNRLDYLEDFIGA